jgi:hypothetical protein
VIVKIETEQSGTASSLSTMKQMIRAMVQTSKATACTQVDETELLMPAQNVFNDGVSGVKEYSYDMAEASAVDNHGKAKADHIIDKLKIKEREVGFDISNPRGSVEKPWALTLTLLTFLEGISKKNENGRVMPWEYMKSLITEIYQ